MAWRTETRAHAGECDSRCAASRYCSLEGTPTETCRLLSRFVFCSTYSSTLRIEKTCSSETPVDFQQTTQLYIPEDSTLYNCRCENLKVTHISRDANRGATFTIYFERRESIIKMIFYLACF